MRVDRIQERLIETFFPVYIEVLDESQNHNVPEGSESHYKVTVVSEQFADKPLIKRHREVNTSLKQELDNGMHALALHTLTPAEWLAKGEKIPDSPPCLGGSASKE
jgi:BolA protein